MYEIACQRLDANRTELDAMQARYEAYFGKSKGAQRNDMSFEQLRNAIEKDKELQRKDETLCVEQGDAFDKLKNAPDYQPFIDNLQTITCGCRDAHLELELGTHQARLSAAYRNAVSRGI